MCRVVVCLTVNDTKSVMAPRIEKLSGDVTVFSLSPGERVGVRASVDFNSTEIVEEPKIAFQFLRGFFRLAIDDN